METTFLGKFNINILGVLFATLLGQFISAMWFGPLFNKQWVKYCGWDEEQVKKYMSDKKRHRNSAIGSFIETLISNVIFAFLFHSLNIETQCGAATLAFLVWLGFMAPSTLNEVLWHGENPRFYFLNVSNYLVRTLAGGAVYTFVALYK